MSLQARALVTLIDGVRYYDELRDEQLQWENQSERARIISKMLKEKSKGGSGESRKPVFREELIKHCMENETH